MAYFPFFVEIQGKRCLIVGGGPVACRKALILKEFQPDIWVVAPSMSAEMERLKEEGGGKITLLYRSFEAADAEKADFVIAATSDAGLNREISRLCKAWKIPVNVVDVQEECSFIFPALVKDQDVVVGISTGGSSPSLAAWLKQAVKTAIPKGFGSLAGQLCMHREFVKERVKETELRTDILKTMAEEGIRRGSCTREQAEELIERKLAGRNESNYLYRNQEK